MIRLCLGLLLVSSACVQAQNISFNPVFGPNKLQLDSAYVISDTITINTFRFYLGELKLYNQDLLVWKDTNGYHLFDAADTGSWQVKVPSHIKADKLSFNLGTDSLTNVSGAMGGDLDPSKGMYWAWNSGFINIKLEGTSPACNTRNHAFQFHLGGYAHPHATVQQVTMPYSNTTILVDVQVFLKGINLSKTNKAMLPSATAVALAKKATTMFRLANEN